MNVKTELCPRCAGAPSNGSPCVTCGGRGFVDEWTAAVGRPGKFEGERRYVPYFWNVYLDGCADRDTGRILGFDVMPEDKAIFPELKRRRAISLCATDDGFVREV